MPSGQLYINGYDAYTTWGITMDSSALSTLMTPAPQKDFVENKSRLQHGKRVVTDSPMTDERTISLTFNLTASTETEFFSRYESFCEQLATGVLEITTQYQSDVVYRLIYLSCSQFTQYMRGLAQFILKVCEPNCNDRSTESSE